MLARHVRGSSPLLLALLLFCLSLTALAQASPGVFQAPQPGPGATPISGPWQFHLGDDPAWSAPALDDSAWENLRADQPWGAQSHPGYTGFAWYRRHIHMEGNGSGAAAVALLVPPVDDAYQVFWNGREIGLYGGFPPHAVWWTNGHAAVYNLASLPVDGVLAFRVWKAPLSSTDPSGVGGFESPPLLGYRDILERQSLFPRFRREAALLPRFLVGAGLGLAGFIALVLYFRDRAEYLFLWLAIYLLADSFVSFEALDILRFSLSYKVFQLIAQFVGAFQDISLWLLLLALFGLTHERAWRRWTIILAAIYLAAQGIDMGIVIFWERGGTLMQWADAITTAIYTFIPLYIFFIVTVSLLRRRQTALLPLAIVAFIYGLWTFLNDISQQGIRYTHWTLGDKLAWSFHLGIYTFGFRILLDFLLFLVLLLTVARQQFSERRRQAQIELEIKSAREVQHVLIPEEVPTIPGFSIASVYKPAAELGGDFYQVIPLLDASPSNRPGALIILGDVSGKGLKAAMTVSLIVGALRTLVDYTHDPAAILQGLNQLLLGRNDSGFATCLVVRVASDGRAILANAGHLSPFRAGVEWPLAGSLPLGLAPDPEYQDIPLNLQPGEALTLFTDGILEARNSKRELFGFDRVCALMASQPSVQQVVEAAVAFGQDDDITVVSITRVAESRSRTATFSILSRTA